MKTIEKIVRIAGGAAGRLKKALRDFLVKVNPGP